MKTWRLLIVFCCMFVATNGLAATFTVLNANDSGAGSLRQAIFDANDTPGNDTVEFQISPGGPQRIDLFGGGLEITDPITIDGSTQPGFAGQPLIYLVGTEDSTYGLRLATSNSSIRSLIIQNFGGPGILVGPNAIGNLIGATNNGAGNIIISNLTSGVVVTTGTNNAIRGNAIVGNGGLGIDLMNNGLTPNDALDPDNGANALQNFPVLSSAALSSSGVTINGSLNSRISSVFQIDFFANLACDPSGHGEGQVYLGSHQVTTSSSGVANFSFALTTPFSGRYLTATATDALGNSSEFSPCLFATTTATPLTFTVVNTDDAGPGSLRQAILDANNLPNAGINRIHFNLPGTGVQTLAPLSPLPPVHEPVVIDGYTQPGSAQNTLSNGFNAQLLVQLNGVNSGAGSVGLALLGHYSTVRGLTIIGFAGGGIQVLSAKTNVIQGNLLGLDSNGAAFGNGIPQSSDDFAYPGILLLNSFGSIVGGSSPASRNVICASGTDGIQIQGALTAGNQVLGNFVGVDTTGQTGSGNVGWGVQLTGTNNIVGGTDPGARNVIALNTDGILISAGVSNRVQGNFIGSDVTGTNSLGNGSGIVLLDSQSTLVGGTNSVAGNVIVANGRGIEVIGLALGRNTIQGNSIGIDASGRVPMGNGSFGIRLEATSSNLIGGTNAGMGNVIAFNGGSGVEITDGIQNAVLRNSIFGNSSLGIDLDADGSTDNDPGDTDDGANLLQNFPQLTSALTQSGRTVVLGTLDSQASRTYRIQLFANDECNPDAVGGKTYLTNLTVVTDTSGRATLRYTNATALATDSFVSATATDSDNNTSEFSPCVRVVPFDSVELSLTLADSDDPAPLGVDLIYQIEVRNDGPVAATSVVVSNRFPANVDFISATTSQGSCSNAAGFVICRLNAIAVGASADIALTVRPTRSGPATNIASVTASQLDNRPSDNTVSESTAFGIADLEVLLMPSSNPAQVGSALTFSLEIMNYGPDPGTELVATTPLPTGLAFVSATVPGGACALLDQTVVCNLADLNPGTGTAVAIVVRPTTPGFYQSVATIKASASDPDLTNNEGTGSVLVISPEPPTLSLRTTATDCFIEWPPGTAASFLLETTTNLTEPAIWEVIPNATSPFAVTNKPGDTMRFFRMRMP